jgi:hypothetical protein
MTSGHLGMTVRRLACVECGRHDRGDESGWTLGGHAEHTCQACRFLREVRRVRATREATAHSRESEPME